MSLFKYFQFVPPIDKVAPDPIVVRPALRMVPLVQSISPEIVRAELPPKVALLNARFGIVLADPLKFTVPAEIVVLAAV
jgi:hypothetical protein